MGKINKLSLPATILIGSIILGGFYYITQISKTKIEEKKLEQAREENLAKYKIEQEQINQGLLEKAKIESSRLSCINSAKSTLNSNNVIDNEYCAKCETEFSSVKSYCLDNCKDLLTTSLNKYKEAEKICWERYN